jgi:hypothetical protein
MPPSTPSIACFRLQGLLETLQTLDQLQLLAGFQLDADSPQIGVEELPHYGSIAPVHSACKHVLCEV